jgi:hypothetical protein
MSWLDETLARLSSQPCSGYRPNGPAAVEPTALAAMALAAHGRRDASTAALEWLAGVQSPDGSLGISAALTRPRWPTGWALLAWCVDSCSPNAPVWAPSEDGRRWQDESRYSPMVQRAAEWILSCKGRPIPQSPECSHDTTLEAWPWVEGTHSWIEPTAIHLLALKASGYGGHACSRDAVRLLCDRAARAGGWNYGNPELSGVPLPAQVQPTGLALAALAGESGAKREVELAVAYLRRTLSPRVTTASLCYAILGLAAHGQRSPQFSTWLESAARRTLGEDAAPYRLALLALAASA